MSKVFKSVSDAVVIHRIEELDNGALPLHTRGLTVAASHGVLDLMRAAGVVPAVPDDEPAIEDILDEFRSGNARQWHQLHAEWPALFQLLSNLAGEPVSDPLIDILSQPREA